MTTIAVFLFIILWTAFFIVVGIPDLFNMLGGTAEYYLILPIIVLINLKFKELSKIVWSVIFTLIGFIFLNYFYMYFLSHYKYFNFVILLYLIWLPPVFILLIGYFFTFQSFLLWEKDLQRKEEKDTLRYFGVIAFSCFWLPLVLNIPILFRFEKERNINSLSYQLIFAAFIIGSVILIFLLKKIKIDILNHYAKPLIRFNSNFKKIQKWLIIGITLLLLSSMVREYDYRKEWVIWAETTITFIFYVLLLIKFGEILFIPAIVKDGKSSTAFIISKKEIKKIIIAFVLGIVFFWIISVILCISASFNS